MDSELIKVQRNRRQRQPGTGCRNGLISHIQIHLVRGWLVVLCVVVVQCRSQGAEARGTSAVVDGTAAVISTAGGSVPTTSPQDDYHFENDIIPILSKFGCNMSACHGKAEGQNGFKLSVFGSDPAADHAALTFEGRGRRTIPAIPEQSLLLAKASGRVPHGGGVRIRRDSIEYQTLRGWIAAGTPLGAVDAPHVVSISVLPGERELRFRQQQPLQVRATWSNGKVRDVTNHARFQSNREELAAVNDAGVVTAGDVPGEAAVMAAYLGEIAVCHVLIPQPGPPAFTSPAPEYNFIDGLIDAKLRKLNIAPSEVVADADYLRRVYLDVIGTLPTAAAAREFLADERPDRRARLVNQLLQRPEFSTYWAIKWADVLRVDRQALGHKRAYAYYRWIRDSLAANKPYDQFCREVVTAEGPLAEAPAGGLFKVLSKPGEAASTLSQVFLGVRIECAQCHHHPFDRWSQSDYLGMQAFFTQVGFKGAGDAEVLLAAGDAPSIHPRTGQTVLAHALGMASPDAQPAGDRRLLLAAWMTSPDNPWFSRNFVNRIWGHFLGRGLVEPVDDFRTTNPPVNAELLDALARRFVEAGYDFHELIRIITASRVYQTSAAPNATNVQDERNGSRALFKRLDAEVLLDAICQTTGVGEKFPGMPGGERAIELWDSQVRHYFLKLFGRPTRVTACECERTTEASVAQVLHVLNSPEIQRKLAHDGGRVSQWADTISDDLRLVDEMYLTFYSRFPNDQERAQATTFLKHSANRRQAVEDLAWSMLNTVEFLFNH